MTSNVEKPFINITEMLADASSTLRLDQINQFVKGLKGPLVPQTSDSILRNAGGWCAGRSSF
jgi:hypothetical protein